jgi:hypothetical protein
MGLSIHYSGKFNPKASLIEMIDEVTEIAKTYDWNYKIYETEFPQLGFDKEYSDKIYGIDFIPPESEPVFLCFLSNGRMSNSAHLKFFGNSSNTDYQKYLYMIATKTQHAGEQVHKLIIHILRYISKKYLQNFKMRDEGHYWETGDEKILEENFKLYNQLLDLVADTLQNLPQNSDENFDDYFDRLLKHINKNRKK